MMAEEETLWKKLGQTERNPWDILQTECYIHKGKPLDLGKINIFIQNIDEIEPSRLIFEALRQILINTKTNFLERNLHIALSEIRSLKKELEDIKRRDTQLLLKMDENPQALENLFDMIDKTSSKFKSQKEFERWLEEE